MVFGMRLFEGKIVAEQMNGRPGLMRDSGELARSWFVEVTAPEPNFTVTLATRIKYARIHQFGGVITPKKGRFLAIPLNKRARETAPRDMSGLRFIPGRQPGSAVLMDGGTPMYALKTKVTIPKRLNVLEDFQKSGRAILRKQVADAFKELKR